MTQDEIIRMAQQCGDWNGETAEFNDVGLERFAALVAAHEREKIPKDFVKACEVLVQEKIDAVLAEREACAKVCEKRSHRNDDMGAICAAAIRARGQDGTD